MAKPPTCSICKVAHWGSAHVWPKAADPEPEPKLKSPAKVAAPKAKPAPEPLPDVGLPDALQEYLAKQRAARAAYMREYRARTKVPTRR